jgi:hypothetical protein
MNDKDFEKIEQLLQIKEFSELSPAEKELVLAQISETDYSAMRELYVHVKSTNPEEIIPSPLLKSKLDKALRARKTAPVIVRAQMPLYQVAAVALLFLMVGVGINYTRKTPEKIVTNTIREVKYINRPVKEVRYITIPAKYVQKLQPAREDEPQVSTANSQTNYPEIVSETNPEVIRQQEIAMTNVQRVLNEQNGSSMGSDTVLQKMMVTVY